MVENGEPCMLPRMLLANHFHFRRLLELVNGHYLAVVVEWRNGSNVAGSHVDEPVRVKRPILIANVQSAIRENDLDVRIEDAVAVGELEAPLQRERLSRPDVGKPDKRTSDPRTRVGDALQSERVAARTCI